MEKAETVSLPPEVYELEQPPRYSRTVPDGHVRIFKDSCTTKL